MACKRPGVQIPSAPPQVNGLLSARPTRDRRPRAADSQQSRLRPQRRLGSARSAADRSSDEPDTTKQERQQGDHREGGRGWPVDDPHCWRPAAVAFVYAVGRGYNRRLQAWLTQLAEAVEDLTNQAEGLDIETLGKNEDFLDAVATATRAAERTHQDSKIEALRNAVLNAALPTAPDTDTQMMFLRWVDEFTGSHLRLLTVLNDPPRWFADHNLQPLNLSAGARSHMVERALPELGGRCSLTAWTCSAG
jgi:hypothetical protein